MQRKVNEMTDFSDIAMDGAQASAVFQQSSQAAYYGLLTITARYYQWADGQKSEITRAQFAGHGGQRDYSMEYVFTIDGEPLGGFKTTRAVNPGGVDWNKTGLPSLVKVFNFDPADPAALGATLNKLNGAWIEAIDVQQALTKKQREQQERGEEFKRYSTFSLGRVFKSQAEAQVAYTARYGEGKGNNSNWATATTQRPPNRSEKAWGYIVDAIKADLAKGVSVAEIAAGHEIDAQYVQQFVTA